MEFQSRLSVIGCVHLTPLPGSPGYGQDNKEILSRAISEAEIYTSTGVDGIIIENTSDIPYLKSFIYPETISLLSIICHEIRKRFGGYLGLQVLAGANVEALSIAHSAGLDFIRVEGYSFAHVADEGFIQSSAAELMRKRACLRAENIKVVADIKKKHSSHAITGDLSLTEMVRLTEYMNPDGIVLTGFTTGEAPDPSEIRAVKNHTSLPLYIGSGITPDNAREFSEISDYLIVGSHFKRDGYWRNELDRERIERFMQPIHSQA